MENAKIKDLTPIIKHLFWWVPEKEMASLSDEAIVESVLSNGNEKTVRQLFDCCGIEKVAEIFNRQTSGRRINYRPRTVHFFRQYFHRHVHSDARDHVHQHSDGKSA